MTKFLKNLFGIVAWISGISWLIRHVYGRRKVSIILYHDPSPARLDEHLTFLKARYNIIPFSRFAEAQISKSYDDLPDRSLVVTIDDGHKGNALLREVFDRHEVRPLIYLCSQIVGTNRMFWWQSDQARQLSVNALKKIPDDKRLARLGDMGFKQAMDYDRTQRSGLSSAEIEDLRPYVEYGAHTRFHPILPKCSIDKARSEIEECKLDLMESFRIDAPHFAYPGGAHTKREVELVKKAGYLTARTTRVGWNLPTSDPFQLKALPSPDNATLWWLRAHLTGIPGLIAEHVFSSKNPSGLAEVKQ